jgi:hypothetical protein
MRYFIWLMPAMLLFNNTFAQQQTVNEAIIEATLDITLPELNLPPPPDGVQIRRFGDGELKAKIFYKNGNMKMETDMGSGKNYVFYTVENKTTTTLSEIMGRKMGYYSNEEDNKKILAADTNQKRIQAFKPEVFIEYLSDSKNVAGITCYKAIIRYKNMKGEEKQQALWYTPDFRIGEEFKMATLLRGEVPGINKIKGFVMEIEIVRTNSKVFYTVTKIDLKATIDDKTFVIPKGYDIKPQSEMNFGSNFQSRPGG